jgi:hypothetical protein
VAFQAEGAHVGEVALTTAFDDRHNVVGIPEMPAQTPLLFEDAARGVIELPLVPAESFGIDTAFGTDAAIPGEDLVAEITGVGAQLPLMNALRSAKRKTPPRDRNATPPAWATAAFDPPSRPGSLRAHTRSS